MVSMCSMGGCLRHSDIFSMTPREGIEEGPHWGSHNNCHNWTWIQVCMTSNKASMLCCYLESRLRAAGILAGIYFPQRLNLAGDSRIPCHQLTFLWLLQKAGIPLGGFNFLKSSWHSSTHLQRKAGLQAPHRTDPIGTLFQSLRENEKALRPGWLPSQRRSITAPTSLVGWELHLCLITTLIPLPEQRSLRNPDIKKVSGR